MRKVSLAAAIRTAGAFAAVAAVFYVVGVLWSGTAVPEGGEPRPILPFVLKNYDGEEITEKDLFGKPAIVYIWAVWCPFCVEGLADLAEIKREFGDAITVIAINRAESRAVAISANMLTGAATGTIFLLDPDDAYYRAIGGFAMPETIFVDRDGMIRSHKRGPQSGEEVRRRIRDLME